MNKYYKIQSINDIDLQMLLSDYIENFTKQKLIITTTYSKLEKLKFDLIKEIFIIY